MPLQATSGAASYDAFGGGVPFVPTYIEDVFSTWLYTGNNSTQVINNGIDLAGKGGLVWLKRRNAATSHVLSDSARGLGSSVYRQLFTDLTSAQNSTTTEGISSFGSGGFTLTTGSDVNALNNPYASWTFREQAKFFDCVTYTGNGSSQNIAHNLGAVPGCIIVKSTSSATNWAVYHRGLSSPSIQHIQLNTTSAALTSATVWNSTAPTSTQFSVGNFANTNANGQTYVAYLFAHNAGGFGLTGTDNVISCGSFTTDGSGNATVNLGYEPQWVMAKTTAIAVNWSIADSMRGMAVGVAQAELSPNVSDSETTGFVISPTATGFNVSGSTGGVERIYIAIRRGPMKTPTSGTSVLGLSARTGTGANATVTGSAGVTDLAIIKNRGSATNWVWTPRLAGTGYLSSNATTAETAAGTTILQANPWDVMDGVKVGTTSNLTNASGNTFANYLLDRAPGFMDVVCYTGTGTTFNQQHNLAAVPGLVICKRRNGADSWFVYADGFGGSNGRLNSTDPFGSVMNRITAATSTTFTVAGGTEVNQSGGTYVAYLFASCPGVSKVGSYTGNGSSSQTINCGFTNGARFVMIKRTDNAGDWYVWDSARGITSGNDPYLLLNKTDAEITTNDTIDPDSSGFIVNSTFTDLNGNGASYIYLAIA